MYIFCIAFLQIKSTTSLSTLLASVYVLTCPRAYDVSVGRLWHGVRQPLLQALFSGFHRGHVTQTETLRPAAAHLQQGDTAVKRACGEKSTPFQVHGFYARIASQFIMSLLSFLNGVLFK